MFVSVCRFSVKSQTVTEDIRFVEQDHHHKLSYDFIPRFFPIGLCYLLKENKKNKVHDILRVQMTFSMDSEP